MSDPFGWYANRLAASVVIAAATGASTMFVLMVIEFLLSALASHQNPLGMMYIAFMWAGCFGSLFGGTLGAPFAFLVLISLLKHFNPWSVFMPLTLGASIGLGLGLILTEKVLPIGQGWTAFALIMVSAAIGGIAASLVVKAQSPLP